MNENQQTSNGIEIDFVGIFRALWTKIWVIAIAVIIGAAAGYVYSEYFLTDQYDSTVSVYVLSNQEEHAATYTDTQLSLQVINDYKQIIVCRDVLEKTIAENDLAITPSALKGKISLANEENTRIIKITVRDADPQKAHDYANAICSTSAKYLENIISMEAIKRLGDASVPTSRSYPSVSKMTVLGGVLLGLLVVIILVIIFLLDNTIKSSQDVERYLGWPTLASIPMKQEKKQDKKPAKAKKK